MRINEILDRTPVGKVKWAIRGDWWDGELRVESPESPTGFFRYVLGFQGIPKMGPGVYEYFFRMDKRNMESDLYIALDAGTITQEELDAFWAKIRWMPDTADMKFVGTQTALRVYREVLGSLRYFVGQVEPEAVLVAAMTPRRVSMYQMMMKAFPGYTVTAEPRTDEKGGWVVAMRKTQGEP